jgi:hypothetical protein
VDLAALAVALFVPAAAVFASQTARCASHLMLCDIAWTVPEDSTVLHRDNNIQPIVPDTGLETAKCVEIVVQLPM